MMRRAPARSVSRFVISVALAGALTVATYPAPAAKAQDSGSGISLIRDTETERLLWSYEEPILNVAGIAPSGVHIYIVNDPSINAFVAEGQNIFVNTGLFMELDTPNELKGVLAHETGHMAAGHLVRSDANISAASIPMLVGMAAGMAALITGNGDAGMAMIMGGQQVAQRQMAAFTRIQESSADQAGVRYLTETGQSAEGMLEVFKRFENEDVMTAERQDPFAYDHPAPPERIAALQSLVDASPYRNKKDSPEDQYAYDMVRAKLRGYLESPEVTLRRYPPSDQSKPARYARAMAYFRQPDMAKALAEVNSLIADEPDNPYFLEMQGQIYVEMGQVQKGIAPYRKAVHLLPDAPLIRIALGAAMLATEDRTLTATAESELETALRQENDNSYGWYELAQAYGRLGLTGKADLATAERFFAVGAYPQAMEFATRAQRGLATGSTEWQRANDIVAVAQTERRNNNQRGR